MSARRRSLSTSLVFLALLLVGAVAVALRLAEEAKAIREAPVNSWTEDHEADCAVVVTGGPGRVREGLDLLAQRQVRKLIIAGVHPSAALRDIFPQWPFYGELSADDVILEKRSTTTFGNAVQSEPLVSALRCRQVILVTSSLHMPRTFKTFRQVFPAEVQIIPRAVSSGEWPAPFEDVWLEAVKSLFYALWAY
jgi:uncharacterized SAM-binding protein YcdF (DUF218 family)